MGKLKSIKKVKKIGTVSRKNPILGFPMQTQKSTQSLKTTHSEKKSNTVMEHLKAMKLYLRYYGKGITVKSALKHSLKIDIHRSRTQLRAFYITGLKTGVFRFRVKASGLYKETSHEVDIQWQTKGLIGLKTSKEIFMNAPLKAQCSCGRHTYWYRYIWTKVGASLGLQEHRFPSIRNKSMKGICCKHLVKVLENLEKPHFQSTFKRYIGNLEQDKRTNISHKDKVKIASSGFGVNR